MMARPLAHLLTPKGAVAVAALSLVLGFGAGWTVNGWRLNAKLEAVRADTEAAIRFAVEEARAIERRQAEATREADTAHAESQRQIEYVTRTILKEVPVYVTPEADVRFALPAGLVRLHDDAATGSLSGLSGASGQSDAGAAALEASAIKSSQLGATIAENYGQCRADQARLAALQGWVRAQAEIAK